MTIAEPNAIFKRIWGLPKYYIITFVATVIWGGVAHLYMFTNKLPNSDDLLCINGYGGSFTSGRWFLGLLGILKNKIVGNYSLPLFNGILAVLFLAASACVLLYFFGNKNALAGIMIGGIMVTFPTITGFFLYMFTSSFYALAIFLSVFAVAFFTQNRLPYFILGSVMITLSIAIYQAIFPFAVSLCVLKLIFDCLFAEKTLKEQIKEAFKYVLALVSGFILWIIVTKLWLLILNTEMTNYRGMNNLSLQNINLKKLYEPFAELICSDYGGLSGNFTLRMIATLSIAILIGSVICGIIKWIKRKEILKAVLLIIYLFLLGIAINLLNVFDTNIYSLMVYGMVSIYIYPVLYCFRERIPRDVSIRNNNKEVMKNISQWVVVGISSILIFCYTSLANETYLAMDMSVDTAKLYTTTLITQIKSVDGYEEDMPVAFIGINSDSTVTKLHNEIFPNIAVGGFQDTDDFIHGSYDIGVFMRLYCGYNVQVVADTKNIESSKMYQKMNVYPNEDSIAIVDNVVVVKFE